MENKPQTPTSQSDLAKTFDPKSIEDYWYKKWEEYGFFKDDTVLIEGGRNSNLLHTAAATECNRYPTHGARLPANTHG